MPFVMQSINTRVVRRSNALLGYPYGAYAFDYLGWLLQTLSRIPCLHGPLAPASCSRQHQMGAAACCLLSHAEVTAEALEDLFQCL